MAGRQVGEFPNPFRRAIRSTPNPLDKSTVISIFPLAIDEVKHTIQPGRFQLPPGSYSKPSFLTVGPSSWWKELSADEPILEIPVSSIQIADSIVTDCCNGLLGCDMGDRKPGIFFIPGEITLVTLLKDHKHLLDDAKRKQTLWYTSLIRMADAEWARSSGNPMTIWDVMRLAARELNIDKPWIKDFQLAELINCVACGALRNPAYPICQSCHTVVDKSLATKLGIAS